MICKVIDTIEKHSLLEGVKSVAVGVSGGADSMCLLYILSKLKEKYDIILKAIHINHNLRGDEALRDEKLVRDYCREKGIELTVHSVDIKALSAEYGIGTEECGRRVRYECFEKAGCDAVAVAHSLSDSIETSVYNLLRGTGSKGLCGIPVKREPNIIRPLISCTREEIEAYCSEEGVPFITDSSNLTDDYTRNCIRHNIIPYFRKINSYYEGNISRTAAVLSEENDFIEGSAFELIKIAEKDGAYDRNILLSAHPAVRKRAILILLGEKMSKQPLYIHTELVNSLISKNNGQVEIASGLYARVKDGLLLFAKTVDEPVSWQSLFIDGRAESPYGAYSVYSVNENCSEKNVFDGEKVKNELVLSSRREGDRFTFNNRKISKSLKKLFNEMKIPQSDRIKMAVLRDGENIVWVEGVGVNSPYMPDEKSKKIFVIKKEG